MGRRRPARPRLRPRRRHRPPRPAAAQHPRQRARPGERDGARRRRARRRRHASPPRRAAATARRRRSSPRALRAQRAAAERDVLACGVVLHRLLAGAAALDSGDVAAVIERMAPRGREFVRLPWTTPHPIAEPLRAIANRSTSAQVRLRYRNARTFLGALTGWLEATADDEGGPVALLLDRLRTVGHLPALPGLATRVQRVTSIESKRTDEIARHLLPDMALSFELLRTLQLGARAGNADRRQRPGADPAPRRRADRRRRRARGREQPARLAGPARRRRRARAAPDDRSSPPRRPCRAVAAPGRLRRRGGVPGRGAAEASAGCCCATTSPTRPSRSAS